MLQVLVKDNNVELALKTLKRKMQREGVFRVLKLKRYHEKSCDMKKRKTEEAHKTIKRKQMVRASRPRAKENHFAKNNPILQGI